jgi:hypothetical protein
MGYWYGPLGSWDRDGPTRLLGGDHGIVPTCRWGMAWSLPWEWQGSALGRGPDQRTGITSTTTTGTASWAWAA